MKTDFIPVDYDYFDFEGRNYIRIIGRSKGGKRICLIDSCPIYLWAILDDSLNDKKIKELTDKLNVTSVVVTHDMYSVKNVANRVAMIHDGKIYFTGTAKELLNSENEIIREFIQRTE